MTPATLAGIGEWACTSARVEIECMAVFRRSQRPVPIKERWP
jgi:hypothetical protein